MQILCTAVKSGNEFSRSRSFNITLTSSAVSGPLRRKFIFEKFQQCYNLTYSRLNVLVYKVGIPAVFDHLEAPPPIEQWTSSAARKPQQLCGFARRNKWWSLVILRKQMFKIEAFVEEAFRSYQVSYSTTFKKCGQNWAVPAKFSDILYHFHKTDSNNSSLQNLWTRV